MSFSKSKSKRFLEQSSCAPPPGTYDPKNQETAKGFAIEKSKRFQELQETGDCGDVSTISCSNVSYYGSLESLTPKKALFPRGLPPTGLKSHESGYHESSEHAKHKKSSVSPADLAKQKEMEAEMKRLLQERNDFDRKFHQKGEELSKLEGRLQLLQKDKSSLEANVASLKIELASVKKTNRHLQQNLQDEIKKALADVKRPLLEEQDKLRQQHQQRETQLLATLAELENNISTSSQSQLTLQQYRDSLLGDVRKLKGTIKEMNKDKFEYEIFIRHLKGEIFALKDENLQEKEALGEAQLDVSSLKSEIKQLQQTEELLNDNIKNMTTKYKILEEQFVALNQEGRQHQETLKKDLAASQQSYHELKTECLSLQEANSDLTQSLTNEQESRHGIERHVKELQKSRSELSYQLEASEAVAVTLKDQISLLENESVTLAWDKGCLEGKLTDMEEKHIEEIADKMVLAASCESRVKDMEGQIMLFKDVVDRKHMELNEVILIKKQIQDQAEQLHNDLLFVKEQNRTREFLLQEQEKENFRELERCQAAEKDAKRNCEISTRHCAKLEIMVENAQEEQNRLQESYHHEIQELRDRMRQAALTTADARQHGTALEKKMEEKEQEILVLKETQNEAEDPEWKQKYEELYQKVLPFQEQLEGFERERRALLGINQNAQHEMEKLGRDYAKLLGHQNQKQKIHHIIKLKDENTGLKQEVNKLRDSLSRQKRQVSKQAEQLKAVEGKKPFAPSKAFQSKENSHPASPLKEGNRI